MDVRIFVAVVATIVAIVGWVIGHHLISARDLKTKRREIRTQYLIDAYRKIESTIEPPEYSDVWATNLQSAIADIQLFGSLKQITLTLDFSECILNNEINQGKLQELLNDLRTSLRGELDLEPIGRKIGYVRVSKSKAPEID